jgi:hypothetical protein
VDLGEVRTRTAEKKFELGKRKPKQQAAKTSPHINHEKGATSAPGAVCLGLARTTYIYGAYTVFLAGKSSNVRSYTVVIYGFGQPFV